MSELTRYRHPVYDSARWEGFRFREGDIVISTPPKCGTTWMQTLCAMLVLDTVEFDRPLAEISPWLDMQSNGLGTVVRGLEAQQHRRLIKTHTPLDGLPYDDRVTYLCVGRDPRDVALSFEHHLANLDMDAFMAARAAAVGLDDLADFGPPPAPPSGDPAVRFWTWVYDDTGAAMGPTLAAILHHLATFWALRDRDNVALFHYSDLLADLPGQLQVLSDALQIPITGPRLRQFAAAATFDRMKQRADDLVPDAGNRIWHSNRDFFHRGRNGQWVDLLDDDGQRQYHQRVADLVPADLAIWAHSGWAGAIPVPRGRRPPSPQSSDA
jgi:hypothetical protein